MLIGTNIFNGSTYGGSDVSSISKPAAGSACPLASTLRVGTQTHLKNADGTPAFTPVPANQIDGSSTGWIVARPASLPSTGGTFLTVFKVTKSATGAAVIPAIGSKVSVPAFKVPAAAPQLGSTNRLDTSDTRNTQAVSAIDPSHGTAVGLWTQHTVFGGAGAEVRWYEINPATATLFQSGKLTSASLFTFNGAVSPDRVASGTVRKFGSNMVLDANTSSRSTQSALEIASKISAGPQSGPLTIAHSSGPDIGFDCVRDAGTCRWGDYASATPDPSITTGTSGTHPITPGQAALSGDPRCCHSNPPTRPAPTGRPGTSPPGHSWRPHIRTELSFLRTPAHGYRVGSVTALQADCNDIARSLLATDRGEDRDG